MHPPNWVKIRLQTLQGKEVDAFSLNSLRLMNVINHLGSHTHIQNAGKEPHVIGWLQVPGAEWKAYLKYASHHGTNEDNSMHRREKTP